MNSQLPCSQHTERILLYSFRILSHLLFADFHRNPVFSPWAPPPPLEEEFKPLGVGFKFKASAGVTASGRLLGPWGVEEERVPGRWGGPEAPTTSFAEFQESNMFSPQGPFYVRLKAQKPQQKKDKTNHTEIKNKMTKNLNNELGENICNI